jgi:AAA15 family ATPase/GTPase
MIHSLAVRNFASFQEETLVEFTVGPKAGHREIFLPSTQPNIRVNAVTGVFGANASGKTNLLKGIAFLRYFILASASEQPDKEIPIEPFVFVPDEQGESNPIVFGLEFEFEGELYRYDLELTPKRVLFESLHKKEARYRYLFERRWDAVNGKYDFKSQDIGPSKQIALRENASFLASAVLQQHEFAQKISHYFQQLYVNIHYLGRMQNHDPEVGNILGAADFFHQRGDLLGTAERYLIGADLGISKLKIGEIKLLNTEGKEESAPFPIVEHQVAGRPYLRPLLHESRGTQALFVLLRYILPVLESGGVAVIDEFETGLHPHMVQAIVQLFYSQENNPKHAQLIANFHSDYLLQETLEKYQIVLTEKNPVTLSSEAWRLDEVKGAARNDANHYAKYHAGAYGGIPNL